MAFYIEIEKIMEDENYAYYKYCGVQGEPWGRLQINKATGDLYILELAGGDKKGSHAKRAHIKLIQFWRKGEYPDSTFWAS